MSNKAGTYLRAEVAHLGWAAHFGAVVGAGDAAADKPDPAPIRIALQRLGRPADASVWYLGDTALDMRAARAAGCTAVLIGDAAHDVALGAQARAPISISPISTASAWPHGFVRLREGRGTARLNGAVAVPRPRHARNDWVTTNTRRIVAVANEKSQNVQDVFLNHVRKNKTPVTVFLVNGVKLQGIITWFDNFSVLLRRDGHTQLVYKHAISTVMPGAPIQLFDAAKAEGRPSTLSMRQRETAAAVSD